MFKALKEKVSNEYEKAKVNIQSQALNLVNNGPINNLNTPTQDSSKNTKSSSDAANDSQTNQYSEPGFSLVDLDDEPRTQVQPGIASTPKVHSNSDNDSFFRTNFFSNVVSSFIPPSDIESEYESESTTRNIDNISKEQLIELCYRLKGQKKKYRERWTEVVKVYKTTIDERDKLKNVLTETQDRALRRFNELKEQCNLEQEAKRHLESNLQVVIEEKEEEIKVLKTKIELINQDDNKSKDLIDLKSGYSEEQIKKIENLEVLLTKSNESLKTMKEDLDVLTKENEKLLKYKIQVETLEKEVENIKKLKDSATSSFTEAKQKMHDEFESRNIIIKELKDQNEKKNIEIKHRNNEIKVKNETIKTMKENLSKLENEKSTLAEELTKEKSSYREELEKKLQITKDEYEKNQKALAEENDSLKKKNLTDTSQELNILKKQLQEQIETLKCEKESLESNLSQTKVELNNALEKINLNQVNNESELETLKNKFEEAEQSAKNSKDQIDDLNNQIVQMNELKQKLTKTESILDETNLQNKKLKDDIEAIRKQLIQKDDMIIQHSAEIKSIEAKCKEEMETYRHQVEQNSSVKNEIRELESKIETLKEKNRQKIVKINDLEKNLVGKDGEIIELNKTKIDLENEIESVKEKLNLAPCDSEKSVNEYRLKIEKFEKASIVTKNIIEKLKQDLSLKQTEVNLCTEKNNELKEEKTKLNKELSVISEELIAFKNKLIDCFYSTYANSEISDIASMNYNNFLSHIENSYKTILAESNALNEKIKQLEQIIQKTNDSTNQDQAKLNKKLEEVQSVNLSLIEENEKLRKFEEINRRNQDVLEEKNTQLSVFEEKFESLTFELNELRNKLEQSKAHINERNDKVVLKEEELKQTQIELNKKDKQLTDALQRITETSSLDGRLNEMAQQLKEANQRKIQLEQELKLNLEKFAKLTFSMDESNQQKSSLQEEINKIKSNAKEILESKHKLTEKLKTCESKIKSFVSENNDLTNKNKQLTSNINELATNLKDQEQSRIQLEDTIQQLKNNVDGKENRETELLQLLNEMQKKLETSDLCQSDLIKELESKIKNCDSQYSELENSIKLKDKEEQELKTEIIALEEKLKLTNRAEKELREDLRINNDVNNSLKDQVHQYLCEINELKNQMDNLKAKHEQAVDKLYKQLEVRESQLDESLMNANSQHNTTVQDLIKTKAELTKLNKLVEDLSQEKKELESKLVRASDEENLTQKKISQQYEIRIEELQSKLDQQKQEIAEKMDQLDNAENNFISDHKSLISQLENEVTEKNTALEEVHEYYQQRLKAKDVELKHLHEQLTCTDKNNYQINALQNSILQYHEENSRLKQVINMRQEKNGDSNSKSSTNSDMENCAILGIHLPQPTEYEYLRNILFQFMTGREPVTLAKVIAAVMRFSNEQTDQIIKKQEALQTKVNKPA